jgi:hypothetical protein
MRAVLGCAVAVAGGARWASSATATAGEGPAVPQVSAAAWAEAQSVTTIADLRSVSARARALVTTPTIEIVKVRKVAAGEAVDMRTFGVGAGKTHAGCYDVWLSSTRRNALGDVVMQSTTTVRNWCTDGTRITPQPTVQRASRGYWGWSACGWDADYAGFVRGNAQWAAAGDAMFGYGSCASAAPQSHHEIDVRGDGTYDWSY